LKIAWKHLAEGFYQLYKREVEARIAKRWQALGILGLGERWKRVKEVVGSRKPIQHGVRAWKGARVKCVVWGHAAFPKGKAVGEVGPLYSPESCEAGICGGSAVGRRT
jgi:hypothetical protein